MIKAQQISVSFGKTPILESVSFEAHAGEVTAIVGPNGSGKTTLLRAVTGDVDYGGVVSLQGADIKSMAAWDLASRRAVLPQASTLAFPFTVIEVVRMGLQRSRSSGFDPIATAALMRVGLESYANRHYQDLSGGEQQRVQLARVLSQVWLPFEEGMPRWLFLDEPVSSLDIGHQLQVMRIMKDFAQAGGGVITVMHDLNLTAMYADRVLMMSGGELIASDTPKNVFTDETLSRAYNCRLKTNALPEHGVPFLLPQMAQEGAFQKQGN
ncbi:heme ABC transporter ATP-binding protein [Sulfitobacter donghicola]|uniref:Iron ABC transporter n=1 Tax=Sulfitobacter donghicola DSW-25 = KCTC 12864 = JCM 14565 TaxID=1300350 RepID=A0A073IG60_9RHOB|nr:heme ABC transporter ATP-binding protein [Sulfitobacter donghicola]KEJ88505.1 iron ABC transporter [Sulfitobacter donghicola DSW-25 = KCTC 12864 = JCM 14565]KIN69618.1 Hemin importer ATP-binding subunit [Sulfitobacter donghicola DSW-25 = KCTC 12864 = JCM 14565]